LVTGIAPVPEPDLDRIARAIHSEIAEADRHLHDALRHALRAGELLAQAKARLQHGEWIPWLNENGFSRRTASHYMSLAANEQRVAHLRNVREATALVAELAAEKRREQLRETGKDLERALKRRRKSSRSWGKPRPGLSARSPAGKVFVALRDVREAIKALDALPEETVSDSAIRRVAQQLPEAARELADRVEQLLLAASDTPAGE
jgi:hypothetical protein